MPSPFANPTLLVRDGLIAAAQAEAPPAQSQTSDTPPPPGGEQAQPKSPFSSPLVLFAMLALAFWMIVMRPGKREKQDRQKKLDAIKKGDRVVSIGGIHGKVADVDHNAGVVTVEVAPKVPVKFSKAAIQTVDPRGADKPETKTGE